MQLKWNVFSSVNLFCLFLVTVSVFALSNPINNGDIGFYVAGMLEQEKSGPEIIDNALLVLKRELSDDKYQLQKESLVEGGLGLMDHYRIKPLYLGMASLITGAGASYTLSLRIVSLFGFLCTALLMFHWIKQVSKPMPSLLPSLVLLVTYPMLLTAMISTPDSLSAFFVLAVFYGMWSSWPLIAIMIPMCLSLMVRLDNVVTMTLLLSIMLPASRSHWYRNVSSKKVLLALFVLVLFAILLNGALTKDTFWFTNTSYVQKEGKYGILVKDFVKEFGRSFMMLILFFTLALWQNCKQTYRREFVFLGLAFSIVVLRFTIYPSFQERFFVPFYIVSVIMLLSLVLRPNSSQD